MSKKITDLTSLTSADSGDTLPIVDVSASTTKKVTVQGLVPGMSIYPSNLDAGESSSTWTWQSWTPTLTNLSGGTLTFAKYIQVGKTVHFRFRYVLGGAGVGTTPTITLPVAASSDYDTSGSDTSTMQVTGQLNDVTGGRWIPVLGFTSSTVVAVFYINSSPTWATVSATTPFTWASGDIIEIYGTYEAA